MKILHVVPTFYPATFWGGPIYSVYSLCNATVKISGVELRVLTTDSASSKRSDVLEVTDFPMRYLGSYDVFFCRRWWAHTFSPSMIVRLWPLIRWADVVHLTGVYSPPTIPTLLICRLLGRPVVWSMRGALQPWGGATKSLVKRMWEWLCNALISKKNCVMHVTSEQEASDSKARIFNSNSTLIPNGTDIPKVLPVRSWRPNGVLRLLYIGRLHPKKGIENLLYAIKAISDEAVSLMICGVGDEAYSRSLQRLVHQLGLDRCVNFRGHVDGENKMNVFMQSDVCVVPSYTENFGMVVAEALAHGVPVIASKGTPWSELVSRDCGLWVENSPKSLEDAIFFIQTKTLPEMGARGRSWMKEEFDWDSVAKKMYIVYRNLNRVVR